VVGARAELEALLSLPSGYQRDLQATKPPLLRAFAAGLQALALVPGLVEAIEWDTEAMRKAISPEMFATDLSVQLALDGLPFRQAYREAAAQIAGMEAGDAAQSLQQRVSPGGCGNLQLEVLAERLKALQAALK
jgi:argininosuccinate lyase